MDHKNRKMFSKFHVLKTICSLRRVGGLLHFFIRNLRYFFSCTFLSVFGHQNPGSESGSALEPMRIRNTVSRSVKNLEKIPMFGGTSIPRPAETNVWNVKSEKCVDFSSGIFPTLTSAVYPYPGHVSCPTFSVIFGLFSILVLHFPSSLVANISTLIFLTAPFSPWPPLRSFL